MIYIYFQKIYGNLKYNMNGRFLKRRRRTENKKVRTGTICDKKSRKKKERRRKMKIYYAVLVSLIGNCSIKCVQMICTKCI